MKRPSPDALRNAAEWLRAYDPAGVQGPAKVADWLDAQAHAADVRAAARRLGVPPSRVRRRPKVSA